MKVLCIFALTIAAVAATKIPLSTAVESNDPSLSASPSKDEAVIASASVGDVEIPAVVQEVDGDWSSDIPSLRSDIDDEEEEGSVTGDDDEEDYDDAEEDDEEEEEYDYEEAFVESSDDYDTEGAATQEGFEANVPKPIHGGNKDVVINKDNFLPILKTIVVAYTHKKKPSYSDIMKAGGISAFKTAFKYFGKENIGQNLLNMAKKLTSALDDEEDDDVDTQILAELAESYLASHKFKLVLPESVLLHKKEMEEFLDKRPLDKIEGRSLVTSRQIDIAMARADPAVQTILTIGPMTWMAVIGGLFSIPYFFSGSEEEQFERVDHFVTGPSPYLSPPGLPFYHTHQLRRDETEQVPHQQIDQEYIEYQESYNQWYNNWYLRYKSYYDEHYPDHSQPEPHPSQGAAHQQQVPHAVPHPGLNEPSSLDFMVPPPPVGAAHGKVPHQKPFHPPTKPLPAKERLPKQPPPIQFKTHSRPQVPLDIPRHDSGRHATANILSTAGSEHNTFGTFQSEKNKADTHFRVIQGSELQASTAATPAQQSATAGTGPTVRPRPQAPSPRPVYIPTTEEPKTETGFKPITKSDSSKAKPGNTTPSPDDKADFKPPRDESLLAGETSKTKPTQAATDPKTAGGFKPIPPPAGAPEGKKEEPETTTRKVSHVTSGVFKTSPNPTPSPDTTPVSVVTSRPAVFVRTATQKSVRVVTSTSFVVPGATEDTKKPLPELNRPQRHQQSTANIQQIPNQVKPQQPLPLAQPLPLEQPRPAPPRLPLEQSRPAPPRLPLEQPRPAPPRLVAQPAPAGQQLQQVIPQQQQQRRPIVQHAIQEFPQQQPFVGGPPRPQVQNTGFIRTNVPTSIQVVDHRPAQGFGLGPKPATEPATTTTTTTPMPIYALDPFYGSRLSRTDVIFHQLGVEEEGCREQVVCNIYKNPDVYTPYSDFLSRQLTVKLEELQRPKVSDERILRFFRYLKAAREGQDGSDCKAKYPECAIDTTQLSHKPIMNAFQKVSLLMNAASN